MTLYQAGGDRWKRGRCLTQLARIAAVQGEYKSARTLFEESLTLYRELGEQERIGWVLYLLAQMLFTSKADLEQACALAEQSLALLKEIGNKPIIAYELSLLGQIHLVHGEQSLARQQIEESIALLQEIGERAGVAEAKIALARVLTYQSDLVAARQLYQETFALLQEIHDKEFISSCLEGLASCGSRTRRTGVGGTPVGGSRGTT